MLVNMRHVYYFTVLADELHFTRAAARLGLNQPAVTKAVRNFEDDLGFTLLTRNSHSVALTPAGAQVLERCRRILAEAEAISSMSHHSDDPARSRWVAPG